VRLLVIHGPNLNLLGTREPQIYGTQSLTDVDARLAQEAVALGVEVVCVQHNAEGAIIDELHAARGRFDGIALNPGAYTHYSYAIRDAVASIGVPTVELHLSNLYARAQHEPFRAISVVAPACRGTVAGFGIDSYVLALRALTSLLGA
jgi:3-dehydroquinate dehydratase-2